MEDVREEERFDGYYHNQFLIVNDCLHRYVRIRQTHRNHTHSVLTDCNNQEHKDLRWFGLI